MSASFEESCVRFREFLFKNGYAHEPAWITPDDVLLSGRRLYVRGPPGNINREYARQVFQTAMNAQAGVSFSAVGETDRSTLCRVWTPADESERQRAMCSKTDLKMSANTGDSRIRGKEVRSGFVWWWLQLRYRKNDALKDFLFWG
jgi:hypothetical protein